MYGRRIYEIMAYWDRVQPDWGAAEHAFAAAWQDRPKWVVSHGRTPLGPKASYLEGELAAAVRQLKAEHDGEIEVAGPDLAGQLTALGLIDEYRIYLHPVVIGGGPAYFAGPRPPLRIVSHDRIGDDVLRLVYVPA